MIRDEVEAREGPFVLGIFAFLTSLLPCFCCLDVLVRRVRVSFFFCGLSFFFLFVPTSQNLIPQCPQSFVHAHICPQGPPKNTPRMSSEKTYECKTINRLDRLDRASSASLLRAKPLNSTMNQGIEGLAPSVSLISYFAEGFKQDPSKR